MKLRAMLVDGSKYSIKCPYEMTPSRIVVHNTANDASANNEISYMIRNNNQVSFHYAVDDIEVVQGIPTDRNAWATGDGGDGLGNRQGIHVEICYSKSGGERFIKAEQNASKFIAQLLNERGWGIDKVTKHQDYSNKYCPHRTLDMGWQRFLDMIKAELNNTSNDNKTEKSIDEIAREVIRGEWGNGSDRQSRLTNAGYDYQSVQNKVNELLGGGSVSSQKSIDEVAREVIRGDWGNGNARKQNLINAGYDYDAVQNRVNQILG